MDKRDIDKTMVFKPVKDEKPIVRREEAPLYDDNYEDGIIEEYREKEKSNKALIYTLLIFSIILVIGITVTIVLLSGGKNDVENNSPVDEEVENVIVNEQDDEKEVVNEDEISLYYVSFYSSSIEKTDDGYSVYAKIYDEDMLVEGSKTVYINGSTNITVNGERLKKDALIYLIENSDGDLVFEAELDRKKEEVISLSFEGEITLNESEEENTENSEENSQGKPDEEQNGEEPDEDEETSQQENQQGTQEERGTGSEGISLE